MNRRNFLNITLPAAAVLASSRCFAKDAAASLDFPDADSFIHPGVLHNKKELDFIKGKIAAGEQPWLATWEKIRSHPVNSLDYVPEPQIRVERGPYNNPDNGGSEFIRDADAVYGHALQWYFTGDKAHALKAVAILNAWSSTLKEIAGHDTKLIIGMAGVRFCCGAELIRHTSDEWIEEDQQRFEKMLRELFYPPIRDFFPEANGNWDASMIQTMMAMGIFLNDRAMFERAVRYCVAGRGNGSIPNYFNDFGQCQESGRDQNHTQMGIGFLGIACEIAWKQGIDLYSSHANLFSLGAEYTAKYNLGHDVPFVRYRSIDGAYDHRTISRNSRGRFAPIYEQIVNHYHVRMGMEMPWCREVVEKKLSEVDRGRKGRKPSGGRSAGGAHIPWGNLMFVNLPVSTAPPGKTRPVPEIPVTGGK